MDPRSETLRRVVRGGSVGSVPYTVRRLFPAAKHMVDATAGIKVTVTPRDCRRGKRLSATLCALQKAFKRQHGATGVVIGMSRSYIILGRTAIRFETPVTVSREVVSFDRHGDFSPGHYHLSPVPPTRRDGYRRHRARTLDPARRKRRRPTPTRTHRVRVVVKSA